MARLAVPALGCGVSGFPSDVSARAAFDALHYIFDQHATDADFEERNAPPHDKHDSDGVGERCTVREIEFWLRDEGTYAAFADAAYARWGRRRDANEERPKIRSPTTDVLWGLDTSV